MKAKELLKKKKNNARIAIQISGANNTHNEIKIYPQ